MKEELFTARLESVHEGGAILRGEKSPARKFTFQELDVQKIRSSFRLSQKEFAAMLGVRLGTLENLEHRRCHPRGPARVLLEVAARHPEAVWDSVGAEEKSADKKQLRS